MTPHTSHFRLARSFAIAPDRLWALLTDGRAREAWGAPSDSAVLVLEVEDLREGGQERHRCGPAEAPEFVVDTHWYHLEAPRLACFTETLSAGGARIGVTLVTYNLAATGTGTTLTVDVALSSMIGEDIGADFQTGWNSGLDRLAHLITQGLLK
jgi:uncharacterized protein YndB with AHSA1/START domain